MLEEIYSHKSVINELREGILGKYIDDFAIYLYELGYPKKRLRSHLAIVRSLTRWLTENNICLLNLYERQLNQFIKIRKKQTTIFLQRGDGKILRYLVSYLRNKEVIPQIIPVKQENTPADNLIKDYERYLEEDKGLCFSTIKRNKEVIHFFLYEQFGKNKIIPKKITKNMILTHIKKFKGHYNLTTIQVMVSALRSFLHYLVMVGELRAEVADCIPMMPSWRAAHLPVFLVKSETKKLLRTCDRRTAKGRRNYAILFLLLHLGLRAFEVINLSLDHINWDLGELNISGKGRKHRILPLPHEVGNALASYIRYARPKCLDRHLFISLRAPFKSLSNSGSISSIVRRALIAADLKPQQMGAHLLRYTAAMESLKNGATLFEIAELLGHYSVDTTAIYTKIDVLGLRELAQAWPVIKGDR